MNSTLIINRDMKRDIDSQIERFRKGFPWLRIVSAATPGNGIKLLPESEAASAATYPDKAAVSGRCKFVPASGAATRMFKDIFAGLEKPNAQVATLSENIGKFAFYDPEIFDGSCPVAEMVLTDRGLGYGSKPKGVIKFHRYPDGECRTAFAEHLVEGQDYMRDADGSVRLVVTISPEHRELFENELNSVRELYEKRYGVRYDVTFTCQDPQTDTIAVDADNRPFLKDDGEPLFRPAGHGALIHNLNAVDSELVSIKNIDNVTTEKNLPMTSLYKKALMGECLKLRDRIFSYLNRLDVAGDDCDALCDEIEKFFADELCVRIPDGCDRRKILRAKLDRPVRVCGMVRNQGEPGGGPFIVYGSDGCTSLQILEGAQINPDDPSAVQALKSSTHFNPVDIVCCLHDYKGRKFDLLRFVDSETGFISSKSYQGRGLKALELPGLWNGAMSDWNTLFVEVPVETFNPVKVVLDLLRPAHQL